MTRSYRKYPVELRVRNADGGAAVGTVDRFLYTDKGGQDWVRVSGEWSPVDDRYEDLHAFVYDLPRDWYFEENVQEFGLEREAA